MKGRPSFNRMTKDLHKCLISGTNFTKHDTIIMIGFYLLAVTFLQRCFNDSRRQFKNIRYYLFILFKRKLFVFILKSLKEIQFLLHKKR